MTAYYNDINEDAAAVLEAQIEDGVIAPGIVDTRSIKDVTPNDLKGFTQCHFFAGGGLWSLAARLAGWPDDRPIWTGSCPCQPFSTAGKGGGTDDPRHLWPDFYRLICAGRPDVIMGEQVAGAPGYGWFDGVRTDLATEDYASRTVDIPACAVDAPHKRSRLFWSAMANSFGASVGGHAGDARSSSDQSQREAWSPDGYAAEYCDDARRGTDSRSGIVVDAEGIGRREGRPEPELRRGWAAASGADACNVADLHGGGCNGWAEAPKRSAIGRAFAERPSLRNGSWWADAEWVTCHDGKARRTKPGLPFLVDGFPGRVGLWSVAGNAISPILAAEVIAAFIDEYGLPQS